MSGCCTLSLRKCWREVRVRLKRGREGGGVGDGCAHLPLRCYRRPPNTVRSRSASLIPFLLFCCYGRVSFFFFFFLQCPILPPLVSKPSEEIVFTNALFFIFLCDYQFLLNVITALFQKQGSCSQYLMLHLAMCGPGGRAVHLRTDRCADWWGPPRTGLRRRLLRPPGSAFNLGYTIKHAQQCISI